MSGMLEAAAGAAWAETYRRWSADPDTEQATRLRVCAERCAYWKTDCDEGDGSCSECTRDVAEEHETAESKIRRETAERIYAAIRGLTPNESEAAAAWQTIDTVDRYRHPSLDLYDPAHDSEYGSSWDGYWDDGESVWRAAIWCNSCTTWHDTKVDPTFWRRRPISPAVSGETGTLAPCNHAEGEA